MRLIALIIVVVALALESSAMRAEDIKVNKWPADVPCDAVKRNADGSYTQQKDLMMHDADAEEGLRQGHGRGARAGIGSAVTGPVDAATATHPHEPDTAKFTGERQMIYWGR
jgi:hypothetical protein